MTEPPEHIPPFFASVVLLVYTVVNSRRGDDRPYLVGLALKIATIVFFTKQWESKTGAQLAPYSVSM